jgi:hypothetical protein
MKVGTRTLLFTMVIFIAVATGTALYVNVQMRRQALAEAESKALILLDRNLATHTYFSHQLKPSVFKVIEGLVAPEYFEPAWMSSTYAVRSIDQYFQSLSPEDYYYKECAINARDPENEADAYEKAFIEKLNTQPDLKIETAIRRINHQTYYVVLQRGETMEEACLRCHSVPEAAPADMVKRYGPDRSFHRLRGEVVSAVSIRVPLGLAYANTRLLNWKLAGIMAAGLLLALAAVYWFNRTFFTIPLNLIREKTSAIARSDNNLGDQIATPFPGEWRKLATDFNAMSARLRASHDSLEQRVKDRTAELTAANEHLTKEIAERTKAEAALEQTVSQLQKALAEVKELRGFIPICSACKKIRDDAGYWQQIEKYIQDRSDAQFTHGICPDCTRRLYPELCDDE